MALGARPVRHADADAGVRVGDGAEFNGLQGDRTAW
jgi:hypothetical protein